MLSILELKQWIINNGFNPSTNTFSPGMENRIKNHPNIKQSIYYHTSFLEDIFPPYTCQRILYLMNDICSQKICPICFVPIKFNRENCSIKCAANNKNIQLQRKQTNIKKYGTDNPSLCDSIKEKISIANKKNSETALVKRKETNKEKYGVEFLLQSETYKAKAQNTNLTRYGVNNIFKNETFIKHNKIKVFKTKFINGKIFNFKHANPTFSENDWNQKLTSRAFICKTCNKKFTIRSTAINRCTNCSPINNTQAENDIINFIKSFYKEKINHTDRLRISPLELDIFLPDANLAIEYNGLLFHSYGKHKTTSYLNNYEKENSNYHLYKTKICEQNGIQLLHIFENEWTTPTKQKIWKSIIKSKLNFTRKIYARQCTIKKLTSKEAKNFLNENHLQGWSPSKISYGLFFGRDLVSLVSFSVPRYNKKYEWELIRFCNVLDISVVGGFSKLLKHFRNNHQGSIITYADKRYSNGDLYLKNNFTKLKDSKPNYYYWKYRSNILESRLKFQKHKLKKILPFFDETLSESKNMFNNNYRRIWDCGNCVFVLEN